MDRRTVCETASRLGSQVLPDGACAFLTWAPRATTVDVALGERRHALTSLGDGYFGATVDAVMPGARYRYCLDGGDGLPDPASRRQPDGVHGPSAVTAGGFDWTDAAWEGIAPPDLVLYELHVGTFTAAGTFDAIVPHLADLQALGVTALELMPIAEFPGDRNWGYDGVYPFAVHEAYGGAAGLRRLVDAAHGIGLAVVLDVVYNHLGPEGNYLDAFGPYFTDRYHTPWGRAVNFDGEESEAVRRFVIDNAVEWVRDYHLDGLRLDAVHAIVDNSPRHILAELSAAVHAAAPHRHVHVIAESDANDARLSMPEADGGSGLDAQWNDDFHHALHALLTGERHGYYVDFGSVGDLARAFTDGFTYTGQASTYRGRAHGMSARTLPGERLVVFAQNHDQIGNRARGERLSRLVSYERLKLAAGVVLLAPFIPLLFMGEEYGEVAPFQYFVSHSDPALIAAVGDGRRREFAAFDWSGDETPDPQAGETYARSRLDHGLRSLPAHAALRAFYAELLRLRRTVPALRDLRRSPGSVTWSEATRVAVVRRPAPDADVLIVLSFGDTVVDVDLVAGHGRWRCELDSADVRWCGPGSVGREIVDSSGAAVVAVSPASVRVLRHLE